MYRERKRYETEEDLKREQEVVDKVLHRLGEGWSSEKLGKNDLDRKIYKNDKLKIILEVKTCNLSEQRLLNNGGWGVAQRKWDKGRSEALLNCVPFWFAVRFKDKDRVVDVSKLNDCDVKFAIGGRKDRGDPYDIEPMVYIPLKYFQSINKDQNPV